MVAKMVDEFKEVKGRLLLSNGSTLSYPLFPQSLSKIPGLLINKSHHCSTSPG